MDKMMDNPWFLRIVALLLAILMFFTVKNAEEAAGLNARVTEVLTDVPIEVYYDNESAVVTGVPPVADVQIAGPANLVQTTEKLMDFTLFVDLRELSYGEHQVMIQTENLPEELQVRVNPVVLDIIIEERVTKEFPIDPEINEQILAEGYYIESTATEPDTVLVTGAESAVESIDVVKAILSTEAEDIDESFTAKAQIRVLDAALKQPAVSIEPETTEVRVNVAEYSREVPVTIRESGEAPEGLIVQELLPSQETVQIFGPKSTVDAIKEYIVSVNTGVLTASDRTIEVALSPPQGTRSVAPTELTVSANIAAESGTAAGDLGLQATEVLMTDTGESRRIFANVPVEVKGLGKGYTVSFPEPENGRLSLAVTGDPAALAALTAADFSIYVEAEERSGRQRLSVKFKGPGAIASWLVAPGHVTVEIVKKV
ncbi:CdaR family protein [Planococcus lenghuensis]|uniref:YbbR domain-containing protein n=1 Tax=Planococcus lenghuensis TaxID=2213202 RepID=A0A1Q2KUM6_9BACL|nr:CdaR family protein [Planococcus lenghuensis]AQQ51826.1 hypothetical protein B0X71_00960 [Planococcus lenghuensis]